MALTNEQIKNLKPGDEVLINCSFNKIKENGDFQVSYLLTTVHGKLYWYRTAVHPSAVTLKSPPKHAPTRLFRKGDIVEMDTHGRDIAASMKKSGVELGKRYTVTEDENNTGYVSFIGDDGIEHHSMFFWLKLVTPVEELESFGVRYSTDRDCAEVYHRRYKNTVAAFYCKCGITREQAEEHAEAERDRLNEWRKEHGND